MKWRFKAAKDVRKLYMDSWDYQREIILRDFARHIERVIERAMRQVKVKVYKAFRDL